MNETTFRRNYELSQWFWHTQSENGEIIATGGESYDSIDGARNGFLSSCGYSDWKPGDPWPKGFTETQINKDEYIVEHK